MPICIKTHSWNNDDVYLFQRLKGPPHGFKNIHRPGLQAGLVSIFAHFHPLFVKNYGEKYTLPAGSKTVDGGVCVNLVW